MIHKEDIYAAFGKTVPEEIQTDDAVDPFVDGEEINNSHSGLDPESSNSYLDAESSSAWLESPIPEPYVYTAEPYVYEEVNADGAPVQDYRHYGFLRTTIIIAIIVLGFALSVEQQNIIHLTLQSIVLYPWYPLVIIALSLWLLWYKSWIGKAVGGLIVLLVVAATSYFELYDSLAINDPVQTSRSQSVRFSGSNDMTIQIDDIVTNLAVSKGNKSVVDITQSGEAFEHIMHPPPHQKAQGDGT